MLKGSYPFIACVSAAHYQSFRIYRYKTHPSLVFGSEDLRKSKDLSSSPIDHLKLTREFRIMILTCSFWIEGSPWWPESRLGHRLDKVPPLMTFGLAVEVTFSGGWASVHDHEVPACSGPRGTEKCLIWLLV